MTAPTQTCPTCSAPIPPGALYCLACGASSPTEIASPGAMAATRHETVPSGRLSIDLPSRLVEVQSALGDNFQVKGLIGRGGFGEVWSALDVQLGRTVAVKILRSELGASKDYRERFRREARAIARLRHPGIVPIYHVGEGQGHAWFVMPLVEGSNLKQVLAQGELAPDETVRILVEAAAALREAHAGGIVHRDLKPENIMLEGPQRRVLIMDFGVAKVDEPDDAGEGLTETDTVLGSPEYMSPEQATGRQLDARSDIYSLGVVAYRLLAGKLPFDADTPREVLAHHVLSPPEPLEQHVTLPGTLSATVMRCLAKSPDDRWASADDLLQALSAARRSSLPGAVAPSLPPRISGTKAERPARVSAWRRRPMLTASLVAVALLLASPWPVARWRQQRRYTAAAAGIAALYRAAADSLRLHGSRFASGDETGRQYLAARQEVLLAADEVVDNTWGAAVDDSLAWPGPARLAVQSAAAQLRVAGPVALSFTLRPSEVAECRMSGANDRVRVSDEAPGDNCWWQAISTTELRAPLEYFAAFRVPRDPPAGSGLGLAWCRSDADCRIAFLWGTGSMVWGAHRPHSGLNTIALGRRVTLAPGDHELRVRHQDGVLRVWVDGQPILQRQASAEAAYLERPASVHFVVQNTAIDLPASSAIGATGRR